MSVNIQSYEGEGNMKLLMGINADQNNTMEPFKGNKCELFNGFILLYSF